MSSNVPKIGNTREELIMGLGALFAWWDRRYPTAMRPQFEELIANAAMCGCIEQSDVIPNLWTAIEMRSELATSLLVRKLYDRVKICNQLYHAVLVYEKALGETLPDYYESVPRIIERGQRSDTPDAVREASAVVRVVWTYMRERRVTPDDCMLGR